MLSLTKEKKRSSIAIRYVNSMRYEDSLENSKQRKENALFSSSKHS